MPLKKILKSLKVTTKPVSRQSIMDAQTRAYKDSLHREAVIGGQLFGQVPEGHRREFFCLDERTWIWHEEWIDDAGKNRSRTTRYDVRPTGILKVQDGMGYQQVVGQEADNLLSAAKIYWQRVSKEIYNIPTSQAS